MSFNIATSEACSSYEILPKSENCSSGASSILGVFDNEEAGNSFGRRVSAKMLSIINKEFDALEQLLKLRRLKLQYDIEENFYKHQFGSTKKLEDLTENQNSIQSPFFLKYASNFKDMQSHIESYGSFTIQHDSNQQKSNREENLNMQSQNVTSMTGLDSKLENVSCSNDEKSSQTNVPMVSTIHVQTTQTTQASLNQEQKTVTHAEDDGHLANSLAKAMLHLFVEEEAPSKKLAAYMNTKFLLQSAEKCLDSSTSVNELKIQCREQNDSTGTEDTDTLDLTVTQSKDSFDSIDRLKLIEDESERQRKEQNGSICTKDIDSSDYSSNKSDNSFEFIDCDTVEEDEKSCGPLPAFVVFTQSCYKNTEKKMSVGSSEFVDFIKLCSAKWEEMSEEDKERLYSKVCKLENE